MTGNLEYMRKIINSCDIMLEGAVISKERLLQEYADFLGETVWDEDRTVGFLLHTGSVCFDAVSLIFAAVSSWKHNTITPDEVIDSLMVGDTVVFKGKRCIYRGKTEKCGREYIELETHRKDHGYLLQDKQYIAQLEWSKITPYYGNSTKMDGRGLRSNKSKRKQFLSAILDTPEAQIPSIADASTVIVMSRERANYLVNNLTIKYGTSETISLLELVTASYFTEYDEYPYGGNLGKTEPILKITGKVSVARKMIVRPEENKIIGLCVLGDEFLVSGKTELPDLLNRKSLGHVLVSTHIDTEHMSQIFEEVHDPSLFACTKDFLLEHSLPVLIRSPFSEELEMQVNHIIDHEIHPIEIESNQTWAQYSQAKRNLGILRASEVLGEDKEYFIIQAHTLMKLFLTAVFPITHMEALVANKTIDVDSPQARLDRLITIAKKFPDGLRERALSVIDLLEYLYLEVIDINKKEEHIRRIIESGDYKKVAIVVPKAFYRDILFSRKWMVTAHKICDITVTTANRFDNSILFDCIIVTGIFEGRRFNTFKCKAAPKVIPIIYDFEQGLYKYKGSCASQIERQYNKMSFMPVDYEDEACDIATGSMLDDIVMTSEEENHLDEYIKKINEVALVNSIDRYRYTGGSFMADIAMIVRFDNGQVAFFSKAYTPYVFDNTSQSVVESELKELTPGDSVIFTQNNNDTKDIVDAVLADLVDSHKLDEEKREAYRKSKHWKRALVEYVERTGATYNSVSASFAELGTSKGAGAIHDWMNPDSHTVGPLDAESYYIVALLTDDAEMAADPQSYCDACNIVRKIRRKILKQIGLAIISSISGTQENDDPLFEVVFERIDNLAQILQIKSVIEVEGRTLPSAMANKPLSIQEE